MLPWHWFSLLKISVQILSIFSVVLDLRCYTCALFGCGEELWALTAEPSLVEGAWAVEREGFSTGGSQA